MVDVVSNLDLRHELDQSALSDVAQVLVGHPQSGPPPELGTLDYFPPQTAIKIYKYAMGSLVKNISAHNVSRGGGCGVGGMGKLFWLNKILRHEDTWTPTKQSSRSRLPNSRI